MAPSRLGERALPGLASGIGAWNRNQLIEENVS
jgi:hypothetical protein